MLRNEKNDLKNKKNWYFNGTESLPKLEVKLK